MLRLTLILSALVGLSLQACDPSVCKLPNCRCYNDPATPGDLEVSDIPQIVMVSFEGSINKQNVVFYRQLFKDVVNPNNCPAKGTFFVQEEGTDFGLVNELSIDGHEMGINSIDGKTPASSTDWIETIKQVKSTLDAYGVKEVQGVRAPELAPGGTDELVGLGTEKLLYDSSCSNVGYSDANTYLWPYTFDYLPTATCDNGKAPDKPFPGKWEVPVADLHDLAGDKLPCSAPSACRNITSKQDAFDIFFNAFEEHYTVRRTPFLMIVDPAWAASEVKRNGTLEFLQYTRAAFGDNVWIVPIIRALEWIQAPVPTANLTDFAPWQC